jgi:thiamine-phosphate pyrophosphorylase
MPRTPRLHLVTDDAVLADPAFEERAGAVLERCGRAAALPPRGHATTAARRHALGERLAAAALRSGAWLLVNDRIDIAMAVRANGVQLGAASLPVPEARALLGAGGRIGYSAHGVLEVVQAEIDGADFVLVGTIFGSRSHPGRDAAGVELLEGCHARCRLPIMAIGGITPARVPAVARAGAHGVAVLGGIWHVPDPAAAAEEYMAALGTVFTEPADEEQLA